MDKDIIGVCRAAINKIQTTIDGGARLTLDLNSIDADLIQKLMGYKLTEDNILLVSFIKESDNGTA